MPLGVCVCLCVCRVTAEGEPEKKKDKEKKPKKTVKLVTAEEEGGWEEVKGGAPALQVSTDLSYCYFILCQFDFSLKVHKLCLIACAKAR